MALASKHAVISVYILSCLTVTLANPLDARNTAKFWHISDFHFDPTVETEKRSCIQPVENIPAWSSEFCDSNLRLVKSAIEGMEKIASDAEFILWTGSSLIYLPAFGVARPPPTDYAAMRANGSNLISLAADVDLSLWSYSCAHSYVLFGRDSGIHYLDGSVGSDTEMDNLPDILRIMTEISELMDKSFPNTTVVASLGNHDYVPDNQLPASTNDIYKNISDTWERLGWFNGDVNNVETFKKYGYYTVTLPSGMIAVALNTNFYYQGNILFSNLSESDPGNQFAYLENLLRGARQSNTKVLISAHVPYGVGALGDYLHMYQPYNERFLTLVKEYSDIIMGSFFGHEHNDAYKLVYNDDGEAISAAYLAPSVTPWRYVTDDFNQPFHNPGIRLIEYDTDSLSIVDYTQYYFDLQTANQGMVNVTWEPLYTFSDSYGVPDASVASVALATNKFKTGETVKQYLSNYWCKKTALDCDDKCRAGYVCAMTEVTHAGAADCVAAISSDTVTDGGNGGNTASDGAVRALLIPVIFLLYGRL